jgi:hypothetical protein
VKQPEKFTPLPPVERMVWPTNDEAYKWAEPGLPALLAPDIA